MSTSKTLHQLGWQAFFQQQLNLEEFEQAIIARVIGHHRSESRVLSPQGEFTLPRLTSMPDLVLGDWLLLGVEGQFQRLLERKSLFARKAAGAKVERQLIASNVDSVFIVSSLNQDFNLSRIERYLALAYEAQVEPIVVLTKADLCPHSEQLAEQVRGLDPLLCVEVVNGLSSQCQTQLMPWCGAGKTVSMLGSSGVGKSTLVNALLGENIQLTSGIREDDSKGRHTTTSRSMHFMTNEAVLIDTPGMRELQLADCEQGVKRAFAEIDALAAECKFQDCQHGAEPGCAVLAAIESGELDSRRLVNYRKLLAEQAYNQSSFVEQRQKAKQFGKMVKSVSRQTRYIKNGYER